MSKRRRAAAWLAAGALGAVLLAPPGPAQAKPEPGSRMDAAVAVAAGAVKAPGTPKGRPADLDRDRNDRVIVYVDGGSDASVRRSVEAVGGSVSDVDGGRARAAVPPDRLTELAGRVREIRRPEKPVPMEIVSEGAELMGVRAWHTAGKQGAGVKVGILDVGFGRLDVAQANGELPTDVVVNHGLCNPNAQSSHGTTVAEVVHDVAPAAQLLLACVTDSMDFDDAARWLYEQGATVINVSLGFPGTGRGDGLASPNDAVWNPATVVGWLRGQNVNVIAAAGNEAQKHWSGNTVDADGNGWIELSGAAEAQLFSVPAGRTATLELKWDAWPLTTNDLDLYVMSEAKKPTGPNDPAIVDYSARPQKDTPGGLSPTEVIELHNTGDAPATYYVYLKWNRLNQLPVRYDLTGYGAAAGFAYQSAAGSVSEPASSPAVLAVGAIQPGQAGSGAAESYSSRGPTVDGRIKPDLLGFTGVTTYTSTPTWGTSSGAAHVTGAAAVYRSANPELDASEIDAQLIGSATRRGRSNDLGYGVVNLGQVRVPAAPTGSGFTVEQTPRRLLNAVTLNSGETRTIAVPGLTPGATAVVLDVFGTGATASTNLQIFADTPTEYTNLVVDKGSSNQVVTAATLDPVDKVVRIKNTGAAVTVTVDLLGTFSPDGASTYFPLQQPVRLLDTRTWGMASPKLGNAEEQRIQVRGVAGVPATATSVLVNATGAEASAPATLDVYAQNWLSRGTLSTLPGEQQTKLTVVPIGDDGAIRIRGRGGEQHVAVDLAGWFAPGAGAKYVPMRYTERAYDTATGTNSVPRPLTAGQLREGRVTMLNGVPHDATAAWMSVQVTARNRPTPMSVAVAAREFPWKGHTSLSAQWYATGTRTTNSVQMNDSVTPLGATGVVGFRSDASTPASGVIRGTPDVTVGLQGYFVGGAPVAPAAQPAPVGYWKLDEPSGTTGADASGNGNPVTFTGGSSWIGGRIGRGAWLDGTTAYGMTTGPVLRTDQSFSVAAWVYKDTFKDSAAVAQDGLNVSGFLLESVGGRWSFSGMSKDATTGTTVYRAQDTKPLRRGAWTHLAGVYDATSHQLRLYVNGALAAAQSGVTLWQSSGGLTVGAGKWGSRAGYFDKGIDEVRAYQRALGESDIRRLHAAAPAATAGQWEFDEAGGTVAEDSSWHNWDGLLKGGVTRSPGVAGTALQFDGSTGAVEIPAQVDLELDSFTVSAWAKPSVKGWRAVIAQDGATVSPFHLQISPDLDRWIFGSPDGRAAASDRPPVLNEWTHLTGVYDAGARQLRLYVNGQLAGVRDGVTLAAGTGKFTVGRARHNSESVNWFAGAIDKVRFEHGMLTDQQIANLAVRPG